MMWLFSILASWHHVHEYGIRLCLTGVAVRKAGAKTRRQAAAHQPIQPPTHTRGNGVSIPIARVIKRGKSAARRQDSMQPRGAAQKVNKAKRFGYRTTSKWRYAHSRLGRSGRDGVAELGEYGRAADGVMSVSPTFRCQWQWWSRAAIPVF